MACFLEQLAEANRCGYCGKRMGFFHARRGFGIRQVGHERRCAGRLQRKQQLMESAAASGLEEAREALTDRGLAAAAALAAQVEALAPEVIPTGPAKPACVAAEGAATAEASGQGAQEQGEAVTNATKPSESRPVPEVKPTAEPDPSMDKPKAPAEGPREEGAAAGEAGEAPAHSAEAPESCPSPEAGPSAAPGPTGDKPKAEQLGPEPVPAKPAQPAGAAAAAAVQEEAPTGGALERAAVGEASEAAAHAAAEASGIVAGGEAQPTAAPEPSADKPTANQPELESISRELAQLAGAGAAAAAAAAAPEEGAQEEGAPVREAGCLARLESPATPEVKQPELESIPAKLIQCSGAVLAAVAEEEAPADGPQEGGAAVREVGEGALHAVTKVVESLPRPEPSVDKLKAEQPEVESPPQNLVQVAGALAAATAAEGTQEEAAVEEASKAAARAAAPVLESAPGPDAEPAAALEPIADKLMAKRLEPESAPRKLMQLAGGVAVAAAAVEVPAAGDHEEGAAVRKASEAAAHAAAEAGVSLPESEAEPASVPEPGMEKLEAPAEGIHEERTALGEASQVAEQVAAKASESLRRQEAEPTAAPEPSTDTAKAQNEELVQIQDGVEASASAAEEPVPSSAHEGTPTTDPAALVESTHSVNAQEPMVPAAEAKSAVEVEPSAAPEAERTGRVQRPGDVGAPIAAAEPAPFTAEEGAPAACPTTLAESSMAQDALAADSAATEEESVAQEQ